jgi:hypothetical protein
MAKTSPRDLAVAFRSFPRRLHEALDEGDDVLQSSALAGVIGEAAHLVGASTGGDLATTASAVADRIEARPPDEWDTPTLDRLRQLALDAGRTLRAAEANRAPRD